MIPEAAQAAPWHRGERAIQRSAGVAERMAEIGPRVIRDHLIPQHRDFYSLLSFVVLGAVDPAGDVWASLRAGEPGFLRSPDPLHLHAALTRDPADPAEAGLEDGAAVGLLGIDLATRRRNRLNGTLRRRDARGFDVSVAESFGNCPQYIRPRLGRPAPDAGDARPGPTLSERLEGPARAIVAAAETFFVASSLDREDGRRQVDVSHRGGPAGFVRIDEDGMLTVPDYPGNRFFNTLGNMLANPRAGLVFADFTTGDLVQMTGEADVVLDGPEIGRVAGAERLWRFAPRKVVFRPGAFPLRFTPA
ncbi:pyridoxamine 5'-phosphate oxidase family protein [Methylobacterium organophilum]|uniref:pyridoxamine 5'-phosphate oxidase family protein n=1 Tax=Methylobacterium organophilum TaxID=410 RepID=UPI001F1341DE|nr:pyridoxamine 5'-phosphate oxidase family protein [Methylobacterium organophilum]UMY17041.1 pyridoxamine 5'-phosphate oxidase family protein [Methylobacterium organophilum]